MAGKSERQSNAEIIWKPDPGPQSNFISCPVFEVAYGGARGGGKTDGVLGEWVKHSHTHGRYSSGLMVRRTLEELSDTIKRSHELYLPLGARFKSQKNTWIMPNKSELKFRYLENDEDAQNYQGHSYTRLYGEEIGNFPSPSPIFKLMATLRSGHGIPCGARFTFNPGGPGHTWVKERYWDPDPLGYRIIVEDFTNPFTGEVKQRERVFIPAKVTDNQHINRTDYIANLQMVGTPALVRAWLEGDFTILAGAYFPNFGRIIIPPFPIPKWYLRFRSYDHGHARPFSVGYWAVADGNWDLPGPCPFRNGELIRYKEWYGAKGINVGMEMSVPEIARGILERDAGDKIAYSVADPSIWKQEGGPSIGEEFAKHGVEFIPADNTRLAGAHQIHARIYGEDDRPMVWCFSTNTATIRTMTSLLHDEKRPEDVDTTGEDHAYDDFRYGVMSRPWTQKKPVEVNYEWNKFAVGDLFQRKIRANANKRY